MKYALYNNKENRFVKLLATRMLSHETIYELTSDVEDVKELTDKPYTEAELHHFEEVAGVEKGSFENYKLSMQDEQAYKVYNARDKSLQAIHDYLCMLDPRRHLRVNRFNRPVVYVVKYIYADAYGSYDEVDVFANEEDAIEFVQKLKDSNLGVSDVSINTRMVYLDKDKTLDNVDNL